MSLSLSLSQSQGLSRETVSAMAGSVSLACWIIVFTPQIYENWRRKSAEGLSVAFVAIWLLGDLFNVFGSVLQKVLPTMLILAIYYTLADTVLLWQCYKYRNRSPTVPEVDEESPLIERECAFLERVIGNSRYATVIENTVIVALVVICGLIGSKFSNNASGPSGPSGEQEISVSGQIMGWICALLYLASRVPQIVLNARRKCTDGVSILFFVFALLGNVTYCISIFAADSSLHSLTINASWILGSAGSLLLDITVLVQFYMYRNNSVEL
ncbi:cationic amino acid transporter [Starmerella bacillaris]|uniref:Cationic amino acid transporter n=1 Tax=Starmerella bacillaris TaxID=1247836 RepID=A0AAV5RE24_STABA|nr:cationic amino acid transporter [Starmerella bacillaris]